MASPTDTQFAAYAGQEVAGGSSTTPYNQPIIDFGDPFSQTVLANMAKIQGFMPKIGSTIIHQTPVYESPLLRIFNRREDPFGVAAEHAMFSGGAANKLNDGKCVPTGSVSMVSQLTAANFAWNIPISVYDREVAGGVMTNAQVAEYVAQKMRTMQATINRMQFEGAKVLLSDCVPGSRTVSGNTASDASGTSVTYTSTPDGYAGKVFINKKWTIPEIARGSKPTLANTTTGESTMDMVLQYLQQAESMVADMMYPGTDYNLLSGVNFCRERPYLIMETKVLNQFDNEIANATTANGYGYSGFPTKTAREYIARFADLVEIDAFAALPAYDSTTYPTSVDYSGTRLTAVLLDKEAPWLITKWANVEGQRCAGDRKMGYSARGEQDMAIWKGANSAVIITDA